MALGYQVPWTYPGGPPCCCDNDCFTSLNTEFDPPYTTGQWIPILDAHYATVFAGGTWSVDIQAELEGVTISTVPVATRQDFASINATDIELSSVASSSLMASLPANQAPCFNAFTSEGFSVSRSTSGYSPSVSADTISTQLNMSIGLGTDYLSLSRQRYIQAMMLDALAFQYRAQNSFYTLQVGQLSSITNVSPYRNQDQPPATAALTITIGGISYAATTVYVKRKFGLTSASANYITGSIAVDLVFSPAAP